MNENVISYIIYLSVISIIAFYVGHILFKNGRHFLLDIFNNDERTADPVNRILLLGYYLLNLGYALLLIANWKTIDSYRMMIENLAENIGWIVIFLGTFHYFNILSFSVWKYIRTYKITNTKI